MCLMLENSEDTLVLAAWSSLVTLTSNLHAMLEPKIMFE